MKRIPADSLTYEVWEKLSQEEWENSAKSLATKIVDRKNLFEQHKKATDAFRAKDDELAKEINTVAHHVLERQRLITVRCCRKPDLDSSSMKIVRLDTNEVIGQEPMTPAEKFHARQQPLFCDFVGAEVNE